MKARILLIILCCSFSLLAGCASQGDVLAATTDASLPRSLTCLDRNGDGACIKKMCTSTSGAFNNDCATYADACISAGLTWSGGAQVGICSKP